MSRALLVYGAFLLLGLGFLGWRLMQLSSLSDDSNEGEKPTNRRWEAPADETLPFPYDRSGRIAAFRALARDDDRQPLFWLKGNLKVVVDDDWNDGRPHLEVATLPRPALESLMRALNSLPAAVEDPLLDLERRDRDQSSVMSQVNTSILSAMIDKALEGRERKPYTPQALALAALPSAADAIMQPWPLRRPTLRQLIAKERVVILKSSKVDEILEKLRAGGVFQQGDERAAVRVQVLTDRP